MIPTTTKDRADANLLDGLVSRPRAVYTEFPQVRTISADFRVVGSGQPLESGESD